MEEEKDDGPNEEMSEEQAKAMEELLSSVKDLGLYNLSAMGALAWQHLGLVPLPGKTETHLDLEQARLAIDLFEANLNILSPHLDKEVQKQLKRTLMDLQMNFVNKSNKP